MIENVDSLILETINNGKIFRTPAIHTKNQGQIHKFTFYPATKFIPTFRCKFLATSFISMCSITFLQVQEGLRMVAGITPQSLLQVQKNRPCDKILLTQTIYDHGPSHKTRYPKEKNVSKTIQDYHTRKDTQKRQRKCQRLFQFKEETLL